MRLPDVLVAILAFLPTTFAALPTQAEGFASSTTGGKGGQVVRPKNNQELANYLKDNTARIIYLERTFDFEGSEGSATETGCAPWGTGAHCQLSINKNQWCTNYNPGAQKVTVKYDKAGLNPLMVGSNKSIIGVGSKGVIKGKGLRLANGVKNVIIQNIHITDLNPSLVWGGDAITLDGTDNIWIDHCTTSLIGRQHIVLGTGASGRVSITNNKIDGFVTFKGNYMYHVSSRAPKVSGNTLLHVVNNYFHDVFDHAFEIEENGQVLAEGNAFQNVKNPLKTGTKGRLFTVPTAESAAFCKASLGRACQVNAFGICGAFRGYDTGFLGSFKGKTIASAASAESAKNAMTKAGFDACLPQIVLILSNIAAVEAARVSKCGHGRPKDGNSVLDVSIDPYTTTAEYSSSIISSISTKVELAKTGQAQTAVSTETPQHSFIIDIQTTKKPTTALKEPTKRFCGKPNESGVLFGTPWIVFFMNYNYQCIKACSCVGYCDYEGSDDNQTIPWSVLWDIDPDVGTNLVKGYNFIGLLLA
ncbi:pectin lyase precursor [Fusarium coicis]|nr:pectin lyase precursor [Fusarium coicis]